MKKFFNYKRLILYLIRKTEIQFIPTKSFIKMFYKHRMNKKLDLQKPLTMNEKLQWLKVYDRNPLYNTLVDKHMVRSVIGDKIGVNYLIPLLGVWDNFEEIDFDSLPEKFVLKTTHDSGSVIICKEFKQFNMENAKRILTHSLQHNYYYRGGEWPYKNIKHKIIAEKYVTDKPDTSELTDYKFYCFNGKVDSVMLCIDREKGDPKFYFFDEEWSLKRYNILGKNAPDDFTLSKPDCIDEMFKLAKEISKDLPFARIDLYNSCGNIYFGEITLYPSSGCEKNILEEFELSLGNKIDLNLAKRNR